jgi:glycosyltransferase involved in cell wall biosynthesis
MVTSSSDVPMKGLVPLLEAVSLLRASRDVELVVVGRPREGGRVDRALDRLGLRPVVHFVSGISDDELARRYAEAEIAVVPSLYEGFSLPAIEAMACGVPVVTTTGGALPEVVGADGETAALVPPDDPLALAEAIGRLLDDPGARRRLGEAGRARVLRRFTWRVTAEGTAACYRALLDGPAAAASPAAPAPRAASPAAPASQTLGPAPTGEPALLADQRADAPLTGAAEC